MSVVAVVLNHGCWSDTVTCVRSLESGTVVPDGIVLVDNPTHETAPLPPEERQARVPSSLQDRDVTWCEHNTGYAGGNNRGIRTALTAGATFVWLVNPDCAVEPTTLARLLETMERRPGTGVIGPRILRGRAGAPAAPIWFDGGVIDWQDGVSTRHLNSGKDPADVVPAVRDVDYVTGACLLVRSNVLREVGLLPERYFLYFEETDFCVRAARLGYGVLVDQVAVAHHDKRSSGDLPEPYHVYYFARNRLLFADEFAPRRHAEVEAHLRGTWLAVWRRKVKAAAPAWLPTFDDLAELAILDARLGRDGRRIVIESLASPSPPDLRR